MQKFARIIYWIEAIGLNLLTGLFTFFAPDRFIANFTTDTLPAVPLEFIRWYGVLLFVLAYVVIRTLLNGNNETLKVLVEGLLLGDLIHLVAIGFFFRAGAALTLSTGFMIFTTVSLAVIRTLWLLQVNRQPRTAASARKRHA